MTFRKIGLILRASIAHELHHEYDVLKKSRQNRAGNCLQDAGGSCIEALRFLKKFLERKQIDAGRGSFTVPQAVEGDCTPEGLHNSFLSIAPFVASKMIDVNDFGALSPEAVSDSEALISGLNELREYFGMKGPKALYPKLSVS
jgi:hypothetical protein